MFQVVHKWLWMLMRAFNILYMDQPTLELEVTIRNILNDARREMEARGISKWKIDQTLVKILDDIVVCSLSSRCWPDTDT